MITALCRSVPIVDTHKFVNRPVATPQEDMYMLVALPWGGFSSVVRAPGG